MSSLRSQNAYPRDCVTDEDCLGSTVCGYHRELSEQRLTCWCSSSLYQLTPDNRCVFADSLIAVITVVSIVFVIMVVLFVFTCKGSCRKDDENDEERSTQQTAPEGIQMLHSEQFTDIVEMDEQPPLYETLFPAADYEVRNTDT